VKNEQLFPSKSIDTIVAQLMNGGKVKRKKKNLKFVVIWHLLKQGHPMKNFESFKELF
jgi:hypothetical protein